MAHTKRGYGYLSINGRAVRAHRFAYEAFVGPVPEGMGVLHRCDVPGCVRPSHLFVGTQADNMADASAKGRLKGGLGRSQPGVRGEANVAAKLTREAVERMRDRRFKDGATQMELAREFGVSQKLVSDILLGKRWSEPQVKPCRHYHPYSHGREECLRRRMRDAGLLTDTQLAVTV